MDRAFLKMIGIQGGERGRAVWRPFKETERNLLFRKQKSGESNREKQRPEEVAFPLHIPPSKAISRLEPRQEEHKARGKGARKMKKTIIMSSAVVMSLLVGEAMMALVFASVMISGLMAGSFMNESTRQVVECPALAFKISARKLHSPPSK
jgi:hypothetical protein